jgi:MATE family multidrug resistance protein
MGKIQNIAREAPCTLALALPIIAGFLGQMLMGVADAVMVGWVGVTQLAACAFANNVLSVPMVFGFGILSAVSVSASHSHGSNRPRLAGESLRGGLLQASAEAC